MALLFFLLPAINCFRFPHYAETQFLESDTYYYLDVARSSQHVPFFSFDGQHPTNGFHPLWQWVEYAGVKSGFLPAADNWETLRHLYFLDLSLLTLGVGVLAWFSAVRLQQRWLVFWMFCPGFLWFLLSHGWYFSGWSNLNGMETGIEILAFSLTLMLFDRFLRDRSLRTLIAANVLAGLMVLARLDDVFLLLPLTAFTLCAQALPLRRKMLAAAPPFLMVVAYMVYNHFSVGKAMPISGSHKAALVGLDQLHLVSQLFIPVHSWQRRFPQYAYREIYFHLLQMVLPALVCGCYLAWKMARKQAVRSHLLMCVSVGVILKAAYNFVFVEILLQGHWYYGPSVLVASLIVAIGIDHMLSPERLAAMFPKGVLPWAGSIVVAVFAFSFLMQSFPPAAESSFFRVQTSGPELRSMIEGFGDRRFVEFDDGEIGFASGVPSVSGFGLTGDVASVSAIEHGTFLPLMEQRGVTLIAASTQYKRGTGDVHFADAKEGLWGGLKGSEFKQYFWKFLGGTQDISFYRLTREPQP